MARRSLCAALFGVVLVVAGTTGCATTADDTADCRSVSGERITLTARNLAFDASCLRVRPGAYRITFRNRDDAVGHNLRLAGHGIDEATPVVPGPAEQVLTVRLEDSGTYAFSCDPHPQMVGRIVVSPPD